jgi:hypothetical protein
MATYVYVVNNVQSIFVAPHFFFLCFLPHCLGLAKIIFWPIKRNSTLCNML